MTQIHKDIAAVTEGGSTGSITYWSLQGSVVAHYLREGVIAKAGESMLSDLRLPTDAQNLTRACRIVTVRSRRYLLDRHPKGGLLLVQRSVDDEKEDPDYEGALRVSVRGEGEKLIFSDPEHELCQAISQEYLSRVGKYETHEISHWLNRVVKQCSGVSLRPMGGFNYIPMATLPLYRSVISALRECSEHQVYEIPAMRSVDTAKAIIEALRWECQKTVDAADAVVAEDSTSKMKHKNQIKKLLKTKEKLELYSEFLGTSLESVVNSIDRASVTISQSLMSLMELEG